MQLSLTVEETNKLRTKVGLKPIPIIEKINDNKNTSSDGNLIIEISISETNELRSKVGLPLIPEANEIDDEYANYKRLKESKDKEYKIEDMKSSLDEKKYELKLSKRLNKGGLLDRISDNDSNFDNWLSNIGNTVTNKSNKLKFKSNSKPKQTEVIKGKEGRGKEKEKNIRQKEEQNVVISHDKQAFNKMLEKEGEIILTLKDKSIYDNENENEDGNTIEDDSEELENEQLSEQLKIKKILDKKKHKSGIEFSEIDDDDIKEGKFALNNDVDRNGTIKAKPKRNFVSLKVSDDDSEDEHESNFLKRDVAKFKKVKKSKIKDIRKKVDFNESKVENKEFKFVDLINNELNEQDNEELENFISATRKKNVDKFRADIKNEIGNHEKVMYNNDMVVDENLEFLEKFKPKPKGEVIKKQKKLESSDTFVEPIINTRYENILNDNAKPTYGISNMLKLLEDEKDKNNTNDVRLTYTDDNGRELSTKEAYKYLSHKFHGSNKK